MSRHRSRSPYSSRHRDRNREFNAKDEHRQSDRKSRDHSGRERPSYRSADRSRSRDRSKRYRDNSRDRSRDEQDRSHRASYRPVNEAKVAHHGHDSAANQRLSRSSSPVGRRGTTGRTSPQQPRDSDEQTAAVYDGSPAGLEDEEAQMAAMMGFGGFGTTKGEKVRGNANGAVAKPAKRIEYRQYMNRPGGFNRALDDVP